MIIKTGPRASERKELGKPYIVRELLGVNEATKVPQRARVLDFFAKYPVPHGLPYRLFGLPGVRWAFENDFRDHFGKAGDFIGVERTWYLLQNATRHMPGYDLRTEDFEVNDVRFQGYATDAARGLWCNASSFMTTCAGAVGKNAARKKFAQRWKNWTHVWLDFCAPINDEIILCVKRLENFLDSRVETVPVVVTFLVGREDAFVSTLIRNYAADDSATKAADRARLLQVLWCGTKDGTSGRIVEPVDCWQYESAGGAPMGVATFLFHRRHKAA